MTQELHQKKDKEECGRSKTHKRENIPEATKDRNPKITLWGVSFELKNEPSVFSVPPFLRKEWTTINPEKAIMSKEADKGRSPGPGERRDPSG
jgi:hypothetical protein